MKTFALDTESEYDAKISVTTLGAWNYVRATNNYLLSVVGEDGFEYVGSPIGFDWSLLEGARIVMANAGYDLTVLDWLEEKGDIPHVTFGDVVDVLDMARYMGRPGSLKGASETLLSVEMSKETRNNMKGKQWADMTPEFRQEVMDYALKDARLTLDLWLKYGEAWPWYERELSRQTREMCMRGLPVDVERAKAAVKHLKHVIWEAEQKIPWASGGDAKILSPKALAEECRKVGIVPPKSLAQDSEDCSAWEDQYGEQYPWVGAMRDWRKANTLLKKVETLVKRIRSTDGTFPYGLKYFGSGSTGRWSGDAGFSVLNMPRGEMYGVNVRELFKAPEGWQFVVADFSSLEPRVAAWISQDEKMLKLLQDPDADIYEAHARTTMGYSDPRPLKQYDKEEGTEIRKLAKARVLGAGYGASGATFVTVAKTQAGLEISRKDADRVITEFRAQNSKLVGCWRKLDAAVKRSTGKDFTMELPSGRVITYWKVGVVGEGLSAITCRAGKMMRSRWWGSKLFENLIQATAREVLSEKLLELEISYGLPPYLHVHDEIVLMVPEEQAEESLKTLLRVMSEAPSFMPGLPLAAEGHITDRYTK